MLTRSMCVGQVLRRSASTHGCARPPSRESASTDDSISDSDNQHTRFNHDSFLKRPNRFPCASLAMPCFSCGRWIDRPAWERAAALPPGWSDARCKVSEEGVLLIAFCSTCKHLQDLNLIFARLVILDQQQTIGARSATVRSGIQLIDEHLSVLLETLQVRGLAPHRPSQQGASRRSRRLQEER